MTGREVGPEFETLYFVYVLKVELRLRVMSPRPPVISVWEIAPGDLRFVRRVEVSLCGVMLV